MEGRKQGQVASGNGIADEKMGRMGKDEEGEEE